MRVPLKHGPIEHDIAYSTAVSVAKNKLAFKVEKKTPKKNISLILQAKLRSVDCDYQGENWMYYNNTTLSQIKIPSNL